MFLNATHNLQDLKDNIYALNYLNNWGSWDCPLVTIDSIDQLISQNLKIIKDSKNDIQLHQSLEALSERINVENALGTKSQIASLINKIKLINLQDKSQKNSDNSLENNNQDDNAAYGIQKMSKVAKDIFFTSFSLMFGELPKFLGFTPLSWGVPNFVITLALKEHLSRFHFITSLMRSTLLMTRSAAQIYLGTEYRIAADIMLMAINVLESTSHISKGILKMYYINRYANNFSLTDKIHAYSLSGLQTIFGLVELKTALSRQIFIDKVCKAVIIEGFPNERAILGLTPFQEKVLNTCDTKFYTLNSPSEFCNALMQAKSHFNGTIDTFLVNGHGGPGFQSLGKDYYLTIGSYQEFSCMKDTLSPNAQVFVCGCNSDSVPEMPKILLEKDKNLKNLILPSLVESVSDNLPGKEVIGFKSLHYPYLAKTYFADGRFEIK